MKILFVCTSNSDRSPALQEYFTANYPEHQFRSAGINKYYTIKKATHYLTQEDIDWSDCVVFCEEIHFKVTSERFHLHQSHKTLNLGEYKQGHIGEDYLTKAEQIIFNNLKQLR